MHGHSWLVIRLLPFPLCQNATETTAVENTIQRFRCLLKPSENCPIIRLTGFEKSACAHYSHICMSADFILIDVLQYSSLGLSSRNARNDLLEVMGTLSIATAFHAHVGL